MDFTGCWWSLLNEKKISFRRSMLPIQFISRMKNVWSRSVNLEIDHIIKLKWETQIKFTDKMNKFSKPINSWLQLANIVASINPVSIIKKTRKKRLWLSPSYYMLKNTKTHFQVVAEQILFFSRFFFFFRRIVISFKIIWNAFRA